MCRGIGNIPLSWIYMKVMVAIRGRSEGDWHTSAHVQKMETRGGVSSSLTSVAKDNMVLEMYEMLSGTPTS